MKIAEALDLIEKEAEHVSVPYRGIAQGSFYLDASQAVIAKAVAAFNRRHYNDSYSASYENDLVTISDYSY